MKYTILTLAVAFFFFSSCDHTANQNPEPSLRPAMAINGTWQLASGTTITKGDYSFTDYTKGQKMISIINHSHFAFLKHDSNPPKASTIHFAAGEVTPPLTGDQ